MNINDYLKGCLRTWDCGNHRVTRAILGLVGEAGEVAEKYKKYLRGDYEVIRNDPAIMKELGDVIYYWAVLCYELGFDPARVMETNLEKLADRQARGKIKGDGDER